MKIVTFGCSKSIHIYTPQSCLRPVFPCRFHNSVEMAKEFLLEKGIVEPKIIYV